MVDDIRGAYFWLVYRGERDADPTLRNSTPDLHLDLEKIQTKQNKKEYVTFLTTDFILH